SLLPDCTASPRTLHSFPTRRSSDLWAEVKASALLELDFNGKVVAGSGLVEDTALYIHLSVHRLAPAARCVLHTHMPYATALGMRSEEHTSELQSRFDLVCRLLLEKT